jgi:hypothetical protein
MTTLEFCVDERLARIRAEAAARAGRDGGEAERAAQQEIADYLLTITPYIKEYYESTQEVDPSEGPRGGLEAFVHITRMSNKNHVLQRFLTEVENPDPAAAQAAAPRPKKQAKFNNEDHVCPNCKASMLSNRREACMVCTQCGTCRDSIDFFELTYEQQQEQFTGTSNSYAYKRLNHLCEYLATLQGKSNTEIPENVIDAVAAEFKKTMATKRADVTPQRVREYLKKLKLNKFYEHKYIICEMLGGMNAPKLEPHLENTLKRMFEEIQAPFAKHCPPSRKNFLSYSFTLYKVNETGWVGGWAGTAGCVNILMWAGMV